MRRRIRSAAFPVHRHALPQLLVDGLLVALAYFLAFWLRFEGDFDAPNQRYEPSARRPRSAGWCRSRWSRWPRSASTSGCGGSSASATTRPCSRASSWPRVVVVGVIALLHPVYGAHDQRVVNGHQRHVQHGHYSRPGPDAAGDAAGERDRAVLPAQRWRCWSARASPCSWSSRGGSAASAPARAPARC